MAECLRFEGKMKWATISCVADQLVCLDLG